MSAKQLFFIVICFFCAVSCKKSSQSGAANTGADDQAKSADQVGIVVYQTVKDLPACVKARNQAIAYVASEKSLYSCEGSKWSAVQTTATKTVVVQQTVTDAWRAVWSANVKSVAYIEATYSDGTCTIYESGTGFLVGVDTMATNGHVVMPTVAQSGCGTMKLTSARVWFPTGTQGDSTHNARGADAYVMQVDRSKGPTDDTVLLKLAFYNPSFSRPAAVVLSTDGTATDHLSGAGVKLSDEVLQIGFSSGTTFAHFVTGRINAIQKTVNDGGNGFLGSLVLDEVIAENKTVYEYDLVSGAGASGGPVFNLKGEVVGINFAGNTKDADTEFGYAITNEALRALLASSRQWQALSP